MKMRVLVLFACALSACVPQVTGAACAADDNCPVDQHCVSGLCIEGARGGAGGATGGSGGGATGGSGGGSAPTFLISGTVVGLVGQGLVLQNNGHDDVSISENGAFFFPLRASHYAVTVRTAPTMPSQVCSIANGVGDATADVSDVRVTCATMSYSIGGTVSGLPAGTNVGLSLNGGTVLAVTANGPFTFADPIASGGMFTVRVATQPLNQRCTVAGGMGTVMNANVGSVAVNCASNRKLVGGTVSTLLGAGLVLTNNGGDDLAVTADGSFAFATPLAPGAVYSVEVKQQPSSPTQTCLVTQGSGTIAGADIQDVQVACTTNSYTVGGTITGLLGAGLQLSLNGGAAQPVSGSTFTLAPQVLSGATYTVTVAQQPTNPAQTCTVTNHTGTVTSSRISNVTVTCTINTYVVRGVVSGLMGSGLSLSLNGGPAQAVTGAFSFTTRVPSSTSYAVSVVTQPSMPSQTCVVMPATGAVSAADVELTLSCTTNTYGLTATVTGLQGSGLRLALNGGAAESVTGASLRFSNSIASGLGYDVSVVGQPTNPSQTCTIAAPMGTVLDGDISVAVVCTTNTYVVGGAVTGLQGSGLRVALNGGAGQPVSGLFTLTPALPSSASYAVTIVAQPQAPTQSCTVMNANGMVTNADITNVAIGCVTNAYSVGVSVTGLVGTGLTLALNGAAAQSVSSNSFTFPGTLLSGTGYTVSVVGQPSMPAQTCAVTGGNGTIGAANASVSVSCTTNRYSVGGAVSGLVGSGLQLSVNGGAPQAVSGSSFTLASVASGAMYAVTVATMPSNPSQTCSVSNGTGTIGASNVTDVAVTCTTNSFSVGYTVNGLVGTGLTLELNGGAAQAIASTTGALTPALLSGASYTVTVGAQPVNPAQTCTFTSGAAGTVGASAPAVVIGCTTNGYPIGGTISGLLGSGLALSLNGGPGQPVAGTAFTLTPDLAPGQGYTVTIATQPAAPAQACVVTNGVGTVGSSAVTNVAVACTNAYSVGGAVVGYTSMGLGLQLTSSTPTSLTNPTSSFNFPAAQPSGTTYTVSISAQPATQRCTVTAGATGTVAAANVSSVVVTCVDSFSIGGAASGLATGDTLTLLNGTDSVVMTANGAFTFPARLVSGQPYAVTAVAPAGKVCALTNATGTVATANIGNIGVQCVAVVPTSCAQWHTNFPALGSGLFPIKPGATTYVAYCDMVTNGGGWALALKGDGADTLMDYEWAGWTDSTTLNGSSTDLSDVQAKLAPYNDLPFTQLRVGLREGAELRQVVFAVAGASLRQLAAAGFTAFGTRAEWMSLLANAALQPNCNAAGVSFSSDFAHVRWGILGNNENQCGGSDSFIGLGGTATSSCQSGGARSVTIGDRACWGPVNAAGNSVPERVVPSWGYLWVK